MIKLFPTLSILCLVSGIARADIVSVPPLPPAVPNPAPAAAGTPAQATRDADAAPAAQPAPAPIQLRPAAPPVDDDLPNLTPHKPAVTTPAKKAVALSTRWAGSPSAVPVAGADGRVIFEFGASAPTVVCSPLHVCDVELEPGEIVNGKPEIGDPRWLISPAISGEEPYKTTHVVIKPTEVNLDTDLIIATNRRTYYLRLVSATKDFVYHVSFHYRDTEEKEWAALQAREDTDRAKKASSEVSTLPNIAVNQLDFNYWVHVAQGAGHFKPVRVFNDGTHVFIQMPASMKSEEAPALVLVNDNGDDDLVNFRLRNGYFIVDRLFQRAALIAGIGDGQDRVEIIRGSCTPSLFTSCD
jgi:type IV secretion system protein VirB9